MYLSRLRLNRSRAAVQWSANAYRVHQRLRMAFGDEPRLLFRIEGGGDSPVEILVQSHTPPDWAILADLRVLAQLPEHKKIEPRVPAGRRYRFRLLANPTVKREGQRLSLFGTEAQQAWLGRKLAEAGAELLGAQASPLGLQRSSKGTAKNEGVQTHFAVLFDGWLEVKDPDKLRAAVETGIGPAKGYGFGLLSLAPG